MAADVSPSYVLRPVTPNDFRVKPQAACNGITSLPLSFMPAGLMGRMAPIPAELEEVWRQIMSLVMDSGRRQAPAAVGLGSLRQARLPGKYRHGLALGPRADELAEVLIRLDGDRAVDLLVGWSREGSSNLLAP